MGAEGWGFQAFGVTIQSGLEVGWGWGQLTLSLRE